MSGLHNGLVSQGGGAASSLGPGATGTTLTLSGASTALQFVSTQTSGNDAYKASNSARWHVGTGTLDFFSSNGTVIQFAGAIQVGVTGAGGLAMISGDITMGASSDLYVGRGLTFNSFTDDSANPGNRTVDKQRGKSAFAIGAAACTITNSRVLSATSQVVCSLEFIDATLTQILTVIPAPGGFTVTANGNATAATKFSWVVLG